MAAIEFHLHEQCNDPGEGDVHCSNHQSNSKGEEEVETLVVCEGLMEVVNTTCVWARVEEGDGSAGVRYVN